MSGGDLQDLTGKSMTSQATIPPVTTGSALKVVTSGPDGVRVPVAPLVPHGDSDMPTTVNGSQNDYDDSLIHKVSIV